MPIFTFEWVLHYNSITFCPLQKKTLLPKGDKPNHYLNYWPQITLLNTVYKIASESIAARSKKHLDEIINPDQTGFISNRYMYIDETTRLIHDNMHNTEDQK